MHSMKFSVFFLALMSLFSALGQGKSTLSGYITDSKSGESVVGARISISSIKQGTVTNPYGFYSLTVDKGLYEVEFSSVGQKTEKRTIDLSQDVILNVELGADLEELQEI